MHLTFALNLSFLAFILSFSKQTSVAELIFYSQKTQKCGHFLSDLLGLKCKNGKNITLSPDSQFRAKVKLPAHKLLKIENNF